MHRKLAARHPDQVRVLVAHEPPIFELLPDSAHWRDIIEAVDNTYHAQGVGQAMVRFALRAAASTRVVIAAGEASAGEPPHQAALAVAKRLNTEPVLFPGGHGGFGSHADGFAVALHSIFSEA